MRPTRDEARQIAVNNCEAAGDCLPDRRARAVRRENNNERAYSALRLGASAKDVAELGSNFTGDHLVAGALMLTVAVIVWCLPSEPNNE
jgi:hypothetical protein